MPNWNSCRISDSNGGIEKPTIKHMGIKIIVRSVGGHDRRQMGANQYAPPQHPGRQFDVLPAWAPLPYLSLDVQHSILLSVKCFFFFPLPLRTVAACVILQRPLVKCTGESCFQRLVFLPWGPAVAPLMPTYLRRPSGSFRSGPIVKTAWPCEAATLSFRTRCRCRSYLSSRQLPLIWTHPRTLTEVGPPWRGTSHFPETVDPVCLRCLLGIHPSGSTGPWPRSRFGNKMVRKWERLSNVDG